MGFRAQGTMGFEAAISEFGVSGFSGILSVDLGTGVRMRHMVREHQHCQCQAQAAAEPQPLKAGFVPETQGSGLPINPKP